MSTSDAEDNTRGRPSDPTSPTSRRRSLSNTGGGDDKKEKKGMPFDRVKKEAEQTKADRSDSFGSQSALSSSGDNIKISSNSVPPSPVSHRVPIEAPDFETIYRSDEVTKDPLHKQLLQIPLDEVTFVTKAKERRIAAAAVSFANVNITEPHVQDALNFYNSDWKIIKRKLEEHQDKSAPTSLPVLNKFESDLEDENLQASGDKEVIDPSQEEADELAPELLKPFEGKITDENNRKQRQKDRVTLFRCVSSNPADIITTKNLSHVQPFTSKGGLQFVVDIKSLTFLLGDIEPFFGSLAIYDLAKRRRITENFYFDINSTEMNKVMEDHQKIKDPTTLSKKALFTIAHPNTDMYLVLRVEKVLQGDTESISDPYIKFQSIKDKEKERLKQEAIDVCKRLGTHKQPFCWGMVPLFDENNKLALSTDSEFKLLYRQKSTEISDSFFLEMVNEYSKSGSSKRTKTIPGSCIFDVQEVSKDVPGRYDPSLTPVVPYDEKNIIREIQEFPVSPNLSAPHQHYVNNLYVYPEFVNFANRGGSISARNIAVKIQFCEEDDLQEGLKVVFGKSACEALSTSGLSAVTYHNKSPHYYDEFKIKLPPQLNERHHLLFTFYHITCQAPRNPKGSIEPPQTAIGYAVLPIYQKNKVVTKVQTLPVAMELLPKYLTPDIEASLKYVDNKKPIFKVNLELVSTVHSTEKHLNAFFQNYHQQNSPKLNKSISDLLKVKPSTIIGFLPTVLDQLFKVMCTQSEADSLLAFTVLTNLLQSIYSTSLEANIMLSNYVDFVFQNPRETKLYVYEALTGHWHTLMKKNQDTDNAIKFSSFLFNVIYKSMVNKVHSTNEITQPDRSRRFSPSFVAKLKELVELLTWELQQRTKSGLNLAKELNKSLAAFVRNLFTIMDRGVAFQIIAKFIKDISQTSSENLIEFKFEFLRIICEYDYFVQLNIPVAVNAATLSEDLVTFLTKKHFLAGILINEVAAYLYYKDKNLRSKIISTLRNLLSKQDLDPRYQEKQIKQRIAAMYFPLVLITLDNLEAFKEMDFEDKRNFLFCFLFVVKNVSPELIMSWWHKETQSRIILFFDALSQCAESFEFVGEEKWIERMGESKSWKSVETKTALENFYTDSRVGTSGKYRSLREKRIDARRSLENKRKMSDAPTATGTTGSIGGGGGTTGSVDKKYMGTIGKLIQAARKDSEAQSLFDENSERNLSNEVSFILLDNVELFVQALEQELRDGHLSSTILDHIFSILLALLKSTQSPAFLSCLYASLRTFAHKFSKHFFNVGNNFVAELCLEVVRYCNFITQTRHEATALLYLLMKKNYEEAKRNFTRVKVQTTIAISKLVGKGIKSAANLRKSLATISKYALLEFPAKKGKGGDDELGRQVQELTSRLYTILRDSIKINQYSNDPEMIADLYHRIAKGYTNAPDLRVAWLESLAEVHVTNKNWAEAAQCYIHIAGLVAEYLNLFEPAPGLPKGCGAFQQVSRNVVEEASLADISPDEEGICETQTFTEAGLLKIMDNAVQYLKQAELYETANELYKLIIPIHEKNRNYEKLAKSHGDLREVFSKIIQVSQSQTRLLGSYYRIAFFGSAFEELDNKEYVYKEPKITRLGEIQDRLKAIFASKFKAEDKVKIITDSGAVDRAKLDPSFNYIQITSVTPYFEPWEMKDRVTYYDRNYNLNRFIFASPFTLTGKSHAESLRDQHKRKTILTVENQFPYVKKRLLIVNKQEINLTPIENSIETIEMRCDQLLSEMRTNPPNTKTLQNVLQGSLLIQVHVGPRKICEEFLGANATLFPPEQVERLRQSLSDFLKYCEDAVNLNKSIIGPDQVKFHSELEAGLKDLNTFVTAYIK